MKHYDTELFEAMLVPVPVPFTVSSSKVERAENSLTIHSAGEDDNQDVIEGW